MVKVGILGAETPMAGEIIRLLINHPETEIVSLFSPVFLGRNLSSLHHGFIGENTLNFTDKLNLDELDFLMILQANEISQNIIDRFEEFENLKLLIFEKDFPLEKLRKDFEIGISEINRKALVRGAVKAYIPSPIVVLALISLVPLANFLLLNSDIEIEVNIPDDLSKEFEERVDAKKIEEELKKHQSSFKGKVNLKILGDLHSERGIRTKISFQSNLPLEEVEKIYDQIYDDHNFTFITRNNIDSKEVEGTQKTVISLKKPEENSLVIESVADARLRGGAGDAIHILNLFFGLHEKTGLTLKPSRY